MPIVGLSFSAGASSTARQNRPLEAAALAVLPGSPLSLLLDLFLYLYCPLGVELLFIGGKLAEQSQKLSCVYKFLVRNFLEHFHGELVVG